MARLHPDVVTAALCNPSVTPEWLGHMSLSPDQYIRQAVARNLACPLPVLQQLGKDSDPDVRGAVAGNPSSSPEVLGQLLSDPVVLVSRAAAANPSLPRSVLAMWQLAR